MSTSMGRDGSETWLVFPDGCYSISRAIPFDFAYSHGATRHKQTQISPLYFNNLTKISTLSHPHPPHPCDNPPRSALGYTARRCSEVEPVPGAGTRRKVLHRASARRASLPGRRRKRRVEPGACVVSHTSPSGMLFKSVSNGCRAGGFADAKTLNGARKSVSRLSQGSHTYLGTFACPGRSSVNIARIESSNAPCHGAKPPA